MQARILTRFTTVIVFIFTCCLTVNVVANEGNLAPLLSKDAWKLLSDAEAYSQGFVPARVSSTELKPRTKVAWQELIKRPNSRVKVKFADELQIRLDVHSKPYSRTQQSVDSIRNLCDALGITLTPTINRSQQDVDKLINRAARISRKQQPDIGGIYWVDGDETSVDVAAELFSTMDEVEWVIYKPVYSKMSKAAPRFQFEQPIPIVNTTTQLHTETKFGACLFMNTTCREKMGQSECIEQGGTFLGNNSICGSPKIDPTWQSTQGQFRNDGFGACCLPNATCVDLQTAPECTALGGNLFGGAVSSCATAPCFGAPTDCGECCLPAPIGCVIVVSETQCNTVFNGIFLGIETSLPCEPCVTQTDCPAGVGPLFADFAYRIIDLQQLGVASIPMVTWVVRSATISSSSLQLQLVLKMSFLIRYVAKRFPIIFPFVTLPPCLVLGTLFARVTRIYMHSMVQGFVYALLLVHHLQIFASLRLDL